MVSHATDSGYNSTAKLKAVNPVGHVYMHMDPEDGSSWTYEGACHPRNSAADSVPSEIGGADMVMPNTPPGNLGAYVTLWQYPLAIPSQKGSMMPRSSAGPTTRAPSLRQRLFPFYQTVARRGRGDAAYMALCSGEAGISPTFPESRAQSSKALQMYSQCRSTPANPSLRNLTKAQGKRLISGITESQR